MKSVLLVAALLACAASVGAQTSYINDNFTGASTSGSGTGSTVTGAPGAWSVYAANAPTGNYFDGTGNGTITLRATTTNNAGSSAAATGSTAVAYRGFDSAQTFTLESLSVGQSLVISFTMSIGSITANTVTAANAGGFSFGLLTNGATTGNNSVFYAQFETSSNAANALVSFKTRPTSGYMANPASGATTLGSTATATRASLTGTFNYTLELIKDSTGNLFDISLKQGSTVLLSQNDTDLGSVAGTTIGGLGFRNFGSGSSQQFVTSGLTLDNVTVSVIPEPSSIALLAGLGALGAVACRRRRM